MCREVPFRQRQQKENGMVPSPPSNRTHFRPVSPCFFRLPRSPMRMGRGGLAVPFTWPTARRLYGVFPYTTDQISQQPPTLA